MGYVFYCCSKPTVCVTLTCYCRCLCYKSNSEKYQQFHPNNSVNIFKDHAATFDTKHTVKCDQLKDWGSCRCGLTPDRWLPTSYSEVSFRKRQRGRYHLDQEYVWVSHYNDTVLSLCSETDTDAISRPQCTTCLKTRFRSVARSLLHPSLGTKSTNQA